MDALYACMYIVIVYIMYCVAHACLYTNPIYTLIHTHIYTHTHHTPTHTIYYIDVLSRYGTYTNTHNTHNSRTPMACDIRV